VPRPGFTGYTALVVLAAGILLAAGLPGDAGLPLDDWRLWLFAALVLAGERLPIRVPRGDGQDWVTISVTFAFAALLVFGPLAAVVLYAGATLLVDVVDRVGRAKALFNAGQYTLTIGAAALTLSVLGHPAPVGDLAAALPAVAAAGLAFLVANHVLAGAGAALLARRPVTRYLAEDLPFQVVTCGFGLAMAPIVVAAAQASPALVPLMFLPIVAAWAAARQAAINAHRLSHDTLTGLASRHALLIRLRAALAESREAGEPVSLLLLDLDDFKAVNDTLGHGSGDALLHAVAQRLRGVAGPGDLVARLGGDEFALLPGGPVDAAGALARAEALVAALEEPVALDDVLVDVRASVGIATSPDDGDDADTLIQHADVALYSAKASAAGCVERYDAEADDHSVERLVLAGQLRRGLTRGELVLEYQPKYPVHGGRPDTVEALARWDHPTLGRIGPDGFIPLAERTGLIGELTRVVLRTALEQVRAWRAQGIELRVAVNVSPRTLLDRELPALTAGLLGDLGLGAGCLQLEITETRAVATRHGAGAVLAELRAMGIGVAIDDFGTGFSSLRQLQDLEVDEMKIDRSFVMAMTSSASDEAIVRSTIDLARGLGVQVTAEGVETEEVRVRLAEMGCDLAQGYHFCRPVPADRCAAAVLEHPPLRVVRRPA
jgi:diguanylate cyclase (GGDEF)-like protein